MGEVWALPEWLFQSGGSARNVSSTLHGHSWFRSEVICLACFVLTQFPCSHLEGHIRRKRAQLLEPFPRVLVQESHGDVSISLAVGLCVPSWGVGKGGAKEGRLTWNGTSGVSARSFSSRFHGDSCRKRMATSKVAPPHISREKALERASLVYGAA